ncbi:MAG: BamA/TamA family outer membrane protein [Candidatus Zixiibacteriota bacterium]|nr:MAG: BamA/TamA family outer membrane protein [candidate division Zixibacteria bacterium]
MIHRILLSVILLYTLARANDFQCEENLRQFEGKVIKSINIERKNVFENGEADLPFYYRWANSLHIKTRKSVIEGELLFEVGQPLDVEKAVESARNIRLRMFIGEVIITGSPNGDNGVDITVTTHDNWTTKAAVFLETAGDSYEYGASVAEDNLLGYGRIVQLTGILSDDDDGYTVFFNDDRVGRTRWSGSFLYSRFQLSSTILFSANRPQYSLDVPYGIYAIFGRTDGTTRLFSGGEEFFRYNRLLNNIDFESVYSIGREKRLNFYALYNYEDYDYSEYYDNTALNDILIPSDEKRSYLSLGMGGALIKYDLVRYLDEAGTPEDLTLGITAKVIIGRSIPEFGADFIGTRTIMSSNFLARAFDPVFIKGADLVEWWYREGRSERIRHLSELMFYYKTAETQVFAVRAFTDFAWRERASYQTILGGSNGLRGYSSHELEGNRLALSNMEYRFYTPLEIFTVRIGGALFFDIGDVWRNGETIRFDNLKSDVGIGLRFGLTKSSTSRVLRLDIARALTEDNYNISLGTGMVFSLGSKFGHE